MTFLQEMEQNADEIRRLLGVPTAGEVALQFTAMSVSLARELVSLTQSIALSLTPIGAIIAWHKNAATNFPPLPANWLECNGQTVNDPASPFHGLTLPSLNSSQRFLRGSNASGATGGASTHVHNVSDNTGIPDNTILVSTASQDVDVPAVDHTHALNAITDQASNLPDYFDVVWIIRIK